MDKNDGSASLVRSDALLDASLRVHATEVVEYILRGNGRRIVPKAIYLAAWEIQYALNRTSNAGHERRRSRTLRGLVRSFPVLLQQNHPFFHVFPLVISQFPGNAREAGALAESDDHL
jgi:hypothetical protein